MGRDLGDGFQNQMEVADRHALGQQDLQDRQQS